MSINRNLVRSVLARGSYYKRKSQYKYLAHPSKTITVHIDDITLKLIDKDLKKRYLPGAVIDGDWDKSAVDINTYFESYVKYQGLIEHFKKGMPWENTVLFREYYFKEFGEKGSYNGYTTKEEIIARYGYQFDRLYDNIKKYGIVHRSIMRPSITPIFVHIGRNGEIIFTSGGNHRLCIAKILGIENIPVRVWLRHTKWQVVRDDIYNILSHADIATSNSLQKHPDLQDIFNGGKRYQSYHLLLNYYYYKLLINYSHLIDDSGLV
jgi:hypothetical protein